MQFFRKHFVTVALVLVALAAIALILPRFFSNESNRVQEIEITPQDIDFTRDGEVSIFKNDSLIQTIEVEFAKNDEERALGLMYRSSMDEHQGMWFIFPEEAPRSFYMRNTEIPLDIIYLDKDKKVVSIAKNARPYDETSLPSEKPAMYVLEINGGLSDKWGIEKGDRMEVK
ncbi:DUF192 domain-containing protein [Capnocytophaga ochracea]|jgi:uncharacterized ACR, COG1430|uniref:DUF192 domain-containing protein n=1 Tax=Capnocytophaga ochracea TaxID=1018 RepID=A0AA46W9A3_CAPOC|nr:MULTISPECIES: DUF192 domain-containing protein [Capnocytophaga]EIW91628.1 hypothetical protein HMPREF1321_1750 [Capnocytophaga sp. oral taxon 412 str. F0487]EJF37631.1 hypothetical protein HMPREF1320_1867 [Capnocytophaga sp. oral taxon 335 str. F0486]EKY07559.1 putative ACR [Capnocytophaga sp. oral taxon 380 str. F0488]MEB3017041.1 DUF192 domain-containing protein [Capnocytophaga ochracea]MEB3037376.1 DUF192 domain-containing protein [Capnocytophaga ochracea]